MTQPRQGRHLRKISLLTELEIFQVRVSTNISRRWRWKYLYPVGVSQLVTNRHRLKSDDRHVSQLVTNCDQLKTASLGASQPVTNCHRLGIPPNPRAKSRQLVTVCNQLKSGNRCVSQSVTNCYRLKTDSLFITQPVTNCNRLKMSPNPRKLIPLP